MPGIRATRDEVSDRFPVLGFVIQTGGNPFFEVMITTDPSLPKENRSEANFFSTRTSGPIPAERGEAVFLVPSDVLQRFAGAPKLYYGLATFPDTARSRADIVRAPNQASLYISFRAFSGRGARRMQISGRPRRARGDNGNAYNAAPSDELTWAGDQARPGAEPVAPPPGAPKNGTPGPAMPPATPPPATQSAALDYDDGYGPMPPAPSEPGLDDFGIEGPIPDNPPAMSAAKSYSFDLTASEYPQASRFVFAAASNYRRSTSPRAINRIVIHITDGGPKIDGTIGWFKNPAAQVSAHYIVGQDGEVVQMVAHNDVAWHARRANGDSIGIEHVANTKGLKPTNAEYCASAKLVSWLCDQFGILKDRDHILGHSEADPKTPHAGCPNAVWDWNYYMKLVSGGSCEEPATAEEQGYAGPLGIVEPAYKPKDSVDALLFMKEWLERKERWSSGVPDTSFFPHSAICHLSLEWDDGKTYTGTGFYISANRILTCAHNVVDIAAGHQATSITVTPGKNGKGSAPFGSFTVKRSNWQYHPQYDDTRDFDLAVIKVTQPPPNGQYFEILEELLECRDSSIIVCGYSGKPVDSNKQHMDGDQVRELSDNMQRLEYNLQTQPGASGSPVFYVWGYEDDEKQQSVMETRIIGVHVAGFDATLNEACRLTEDKIKWIESAGAALDTAPQSLARVQSAAKTVRGRGAGKNIVRPASVALKRQRIGRSFDAEDPVTIAEPWGDEVVDLVKELQSEGVSDNELSAFLEDITPSDGEPVATEASLAIGVPVRVFGKDGVEVTLPGGMTLDGWKARLLLSLVGAGFGPYGIAFFNSLPTACNTLNVTIGLGYAVSGGIVKGAGLGVGIVFGPGSVIGFYGTLSGARSWLKAGISATVQVTIVGGGLGNFTGPCVAVGVAGGEEIVGSAAALFRPSGEFLGISAEVGIGVGLPVKFFKQNQKTYATPNSLSLAAAQSLARVQSASKTVRVRGAGKNIVRPASVTLTRQRIGRSLDAEDPVTIAEPWGDEVVDLVKDLQSEGVSDNELSAFLEDITPSDDEPVATEASLAIGGPVRVFGQDGVEVTLPGGITVGGWKARLLLMAIGSAFGPYGAALFNSLPTASNKLNVTIGIGLAASGGIIHGAGLGVGIVFAPGSVIGFYGSLSGAMGWLKGISGTVQIIVVRGGLSNFTGVCRAVTIAGGEGIVGAASALLTPSGEFLGITAEVGIGAGWPIGFFEQVQKTYGTPQSLSMAAGSTRRAIRRSRNGRAQALGETTADAVSLKEADYSESMGDPVESGQPGAPSPAFAPPSNEQMYRIIREVAVAASGAELYSAVSADREFQAAAHASYQQRHFGLAFGLVLFTQESGRLGSVLRLMRQREPAMFAEIFAPHADALLAVTNAPSPEQRLQPVDGEPLWSATWIERFRKAGAVPAFQAAQNQEAIEGQFRPMLRVASGLGTNTDRALALLYECVVSRGLGGGLRWAVQAAGLLNTESQRTHALEALGQTDVARFQESSGLPASDEFDALTLAALVGALREHDLVPLPSCPELTARLVAAASGPARERLIRLQGSSSFTDTVPAQVSGK